MKASPLMSRSTDRDLLFGLLALQNNFIDRDALVDAFHRWTGDRSQPLDRILLDRGALSPSLHALLTGLVEEHIKRHGGDPERSLAALSSIGSVREDLARIADPDLHASLAHVSAARRRRRPIPTGPSRRGPSGNRRRPAADSASSARTPRAAWARSPSPWTRSSTARWRSRRSRTATPTSRTAAPGSCRRRRSPASWSIPASSPSTAWATTPPAGRSTPCGSSRATASRKRSRRSTATRA